MNSANLLNNFGNDLKESLAKEISIFAVDLYLHVSPIRGPLASRYLDMLQQLANNAYIAIECWD